MHAWAFLGIPAFSHESWSNRTLLNPSFRSKVYAHYKEGCLQGVDQNFYVSTDKEESYDLAKLVFDSSLLVDSGNYSIADAISNANQTYLALSMAT